MQAHEATNLSNLSRIPKSINCDMEMDYIYKKIEAQGKTGTKTLEIEIDNSVLYTHREDFVWGVFWNTVKNNSQLHTIQKLLEIDGYKVSWVVIHNDYADIKALIIKWK